MCWILAVTKTITNHMRLKLAVALQPRIIIINLKSWRPLVATITARYNILILVMTGVGLSIYLAGTRVHLEMRNRMLRVAVDVHLLVINPCLHHFIPTTRSILIFGGTNASVLLETLFITTTEGPPCTTCLHILSCFIPIGQLRTPYFLLAIPSLPTSILRIVFFSGKLILCSG